jgi:CRP/FNR family transcriptional regulator, cyclic AMP receptor protein
MSALTSRRSGTVLRDRARPPTQEELAEIPWLKSLTPTERERAVAALVVGDAEAGDHICRFGRPVTYWFGLVDGLLKMSNDDSQGPVITFTGVAPGGWFGEGTVLKHEQYRYNILALRRSRVAGLPVETFDWLLDHSIGFNRFVMHQLNERWASSSRRARSTASTAPTCAWRATWPRCSTRCSRPTWAVCCASPSRSWPTWSASRASASTRR